MSRPHHHTQTHRTRQDFSGQVISPTQRPLPDNTQHSQETDIHAHGGIRTRIPGKRDEADPRLRPRQMLLRSQTAIQHIGDGLRMSLHARFLPLFLSFGMRRCIDWRSDSDVPRGYVLCLSSRIGIMLGPSNS